MRHRNTHKKNKKHRKHTWKYYGGVFTFNYANDKEKNKIMQRATRYKNQQLPQNTYNDGEETLNIDVERNKIKDLRDAYNDTLANNNHESQLEALRELEKGLEDYKSKLENYKEHNPDNELSQGFKDTFSKTNDFLTGVGALKFAYENKDTDNLMQEEQGKKVDEVNKLYATGVGQHYKLSKDSVEAARPFGIVSDFTNSEEITNTKKEMDAAAADTAEYAEIYAEEAKKAEEAILSDTNQYNTSGDDGMYLPNYDSGILLKEQRYKDAADLQKVSQDAAADLQTVAPTVEAGPSPSGPSPSGPSPSGPSPSGPSPSGPSPSGASSSGAKGGTRRKYVHRRHHASKKTRKHQKKNHRQYLRKK